MIRVAIIGLGAVTRNIHLGAYRSLGVKVKVVAGCDIDDKARALVGKKWHIPELYADPREMIEKTKPDIVSICTPPFMHHELILMALGYGCHVFCEKPLAENLADIDDIIRASEEARRLVVVNSQFPYMNIHSGAKGLIGSPEFGRLVFLHAWQTFRPTEATEAGWRKDMKRRLCFEFGVHVFELIRYFFDDNPPRVFAHMPSSGAGGGQSEVVNVVYLEFSDGRGASIVLDRLSKGPERYLDMRLDGESAAIHTSIGGEVRFEAGIHTSNRTPFIGFSFVKGGQAVLQDGNSEKVIAKDRLNPMSTATAVHFNNFIDAIGNGSTPPGTAKDNRKTMELVFAAYDSAEKGRPVEIGV